MTTHRERLKDQSGFVHRRIIGGITGAISGLVTGNPLAALAGGLRGFARTPEDVVPAVTGCPPGFFASPTGCVPRGAIDPRLGPVTRGGPFASARSALRDRIARSSIAGGNGARPGPLTRPAPLPPFAASMAAAPLNGEIPRPDIPTLAVTGQFGAGFEASIISREMRLCPPKTVLGVDGVCYNRRDLRNDERAWPRGRRPLLTGGEMRAVSTASAAAKKLQRKQKQLQELGLLPRPQRARRALLPGHRATLTHASGGGSEH